MGFVYLATPYFVSEYCSHTCKAQEDVDVSQEQMEKMHNIISLYQLSKGKGTHTEVACCYVLPKCSYYNRE